MANVAINETKFMRIINAKPSSVTGGPPDPRISNATRFVVLAMPDPVVIVVLT
jgi:hypothetical protein